MGITTHSASIGATFTVTDTLPSVLQDASPESQQFVAAHQLVGDVQQAEHLAETSFPEGASISLDIVRDRESEESWLVLRVKLSAAPDEVLRCYTAFLEKWLATASPQAIDRITLSYTVV